MPYVKLKAAGALYRLGDTTGLPLLRQMEVSEHAMVRADALEATAVSPDSGWQAAVRDLLRESDPSVRLKAAKLLAPHDLQSSAIALEGLLTDSNLAMREAAGAAFVGQVASDFGVLRRFLKTGDQLTRVRAAARILDLTR
jgi:HEAT repeat protein